MNVLTLSRYPYSTSSYPYSAKLRALKFTSGSPDPDTGRLFQDAAHPSMPVPTCGFTHKLSGRFDFCGHNANQIRIIWRRAHLDVLEHGFSTSGSRPHLGSPSDCDSIFYKHIYHFLIHNAVTSEIIAGIAPYLEHRGTLGSPSILHAYTLTLG